MLPPLRDLLDPRENPQPPFADSVSIPLSELPHRLSELPPKGTRLDIAACSEAESALGFLTKGNRVVEIVSAPYGDSGPGRLWSPNPWLVQVLPPEAKSVVDLGCGAGRELAYLASLGLDVMGIERLPEACASARQLVRRYTGREVHVENSDFDMWVPNKPYDVAVALMAAPLGLFQLPVKWIIVEAYAPNSEKPKDIRRRMQEETPAGWTPAMRGLAYNRRQFLYRRTE